MTFGTSQTRGMFVVARRQRCTSKSSRNQRVYFHFDKGADPDLSEHGTLYSFAAGHTVLCATEHSESGNMAVPVDVAVGCNSMATVGVLLPYFRARAQSAILQRSTVSPTCGVITTILEVAPLLSTRQKYEYFIGRRWGLETNHMEWSFQTANKKAVVCLSPQDRRALPFQIVVIMNHFGENNWFMYAVAGGCETVYDFDDVITWVSKDLGHCTL